MSKPNDPTPQDSLINISREPIWSHFFGIGPQLLASTNSSEGGHTSFSLQYKPYYFLLYRFIYTHKNLSRTGLTLNSSYRRGYISQTRGSNAASGTTWGNFDVIRMDCGFNHFFAIGENRKTSFGVGCYFGGIISATGNFDYHGYSSSTGVTLDLKNYKNAYQMLNHAYGGISFELQTQLDIGEGKCFLIGIRVLLESWETLDARLGKVVGIFIGYRFGKKPKEKPQS